MAELRTPYFLVDEDRLVRNLEILKDVAERSATSFRISRLRTSRSSSTRK